MLKAKSSQDLLEFTLHQKYLSTTQLLVVDQRLPTSAEFQSSSSEPQEANGAPTRFHSADSVIEIYEQAHQACSFLQFLYGQSLKLVES